MQSHLLKLWRRLSVYLLNWKPNLAVEDVCGHRRSMKGEETERLGRTEASKAVNAISKPSVCFICLSNTLKTLSINEIT